MEFDPVGSAESIPDMIRNDTLIEVLDKDQLSECLKNITLNVDDSLYILDNVQSKYNVSDRFKAVRHIFTDFGEGNKFDSKKFVEFIRALGRCLHIDIHDSIAAIIESIFSKNEQLKIKSDKYDSLMSNPMDQSGLLNEIFNQWIKNERDSFSKQKDEIQAELQTKNIKLAALEVKINELNMEISELKKQLHDNRCILEEKNQKTQNIQDKHDKEKKKNEDLVTIVQSLKKEYDVLLADREQSNPARNLTRVTSSTSSTREITRVTSSTSSTRDLTRGTSSKCSTRDRTRYSHNPLRYGCSLRSSTRDPTREHSSTSTSGQQD